MTRHQRAHRIGRLRALADPVLHAFAVDLHDGRLGARVVVSENFDEGAVSRGARIGHDDAEERTFLGSCTTETNYQHLSLLHWPSRLELDRLVRYARKAGLKACTTFERRGLSAAAQHLHGAAARIFAAATGQPGHAAELL